MPNLAGVPDPVGHPNLIQRNLICSKVKTDEELAFPLIEFFLEITRAGGSELFKALLGKLPNYINFIICCTCNEMNICILVS